MLRGDGRLAGCRVGRLPVLWVGWKLVWICVVGLDLVWTYADDCDVIDVVFRRHGVCLFLLGFDF